MRITDDRYTRDRLRLDLALRLIRHEARTHTICRCTGLTADRVRKLYHTYVQHTTGTKTRRRRGRSPTQTAYFMRNTRLQTEASVLAGRLTTYGLFSTHNGKMMPEDTLEYAQRLCEAYESYVALVVDTQLSFEHAWYLRRALATRNEICFASCGHCGSPFIRDRYSLDTRGCPLCRLKRIADKEHAKKMKASMSVPPQENVTREEE